MVVVVHLWRRTIATWYNKLIVSSLPVNLVFLLQLAARSQNGISNVYNMSGSALSLSRKQPSENMRAD